ncbi:MAG: hypothetical protein JJU48_03185 [Methylophaga sp.]|nr:hypothetical protein [Methylophaga sp.]
MFRLRGITFTLSLVFAAQTSAMTLPPVPTAPIYYEPPVVKATELIRQSSCAEIDDAIRHLHPYRYTYKPGFYQDNTNKIATAVMVMDTVPILNVLIGLGYLSYSALVDEKESRRMLQVEENIAMLQRVKAEKRCFE